MKSSLLPAAFVAAVVTLGIDSSSAFAQAPNPAGANAPKFGVAVVDVGYIFKNHQGFRSTMESMKQQLEGIEQGLKTKREGINQKEQQRQDFNLGSPEYKKLDEELARAKADFNVEMTQLRKEFMEREAKVYYQTFLEVDQAVKTYAERSEIGLVLRFNGEAPDPNQPRQVLESINKQVVYHNRIDITPDILAILNRNVRQAATPGTGQSQIPGGARR